MLRRLATFPRSFLFSSVKGINSCRHLVVGNQKNGVKKTESVDWTDIVGGECAVVARLSAGDLLAMLDICAKRVVDVFLRTVLPNTRVSTVGVTDTLFHMPVLHGDAVRMNGRLVFCGSSSLGIHIGIFRRSPSTLAESFVGESFFTMVAIDEKLRALKFVPAVEITEEEDIALHSRYMAMRDAAAREEKVRAARAMDPKPLSYEDLDHDSNRGKKIHVPITSTRTKANRIFFLYHMNNNRTIFGGELMRWMEKNAVHCGRMFTGNRHICTIGMYNVSFHQPVFGTDWLTLEADVICVRNTTMEVDIKLTAERDGKVVVTNRASFVLLSTDEIGQKLTIAQGLDLRCASREHLLRFAEAKERNSRMLAAGLKGMYD